MLREREVLLLLERGGIFAEVMNRAKAMVGNERTRNEPGGIQKSAFMISG